MESASIENDLPKPCLENILDTAEYDSVVYLLNYCIDPVGVKEFLTRLAIKRGSIGTHILNSVIKSAETVSKKSGKKLSTEYVKSIFQPEKSGPDGIIGATGPDSRNINFGGSGADDSWKVNIFDRGMDKALHETALGQGRDGSHERRWLENVDPDREDINEDVGENLEPE